MNSINKLLKIKKNIFEIFGISDETYAENYRNSYQGIISKTEEGIIQKINRLDHYPTIYPPCRKEKLESIFSKMALHYKKHIDLEGYSSIGIHQLESCLTEEEKDFLKDAYPNYINLNNEIHIYLNDLGIIKKINCKNANMQKITNKFNGKSIIELRDTFTTLGISTYTYELDSLIYDYYDSRKKRELILSGVACELLKMGDIEIMAPIAYAFSKLFKIETQNAIICTDPHNSNLMELAHTYFRDGGRLNVIVYTPDYHGNFNCPMFLDKALEESRQYKKLTK